MEFYLSVGEPWDFSSPDGENIIKGTLTIESDDFAIFKANYEIELKNVKSKILILHPRYENDGFSQLREKSFLVIGGALISEKDYKSCSSIKEMDLKAVYVIIGSVEVKNLSKLFKLFWKKIKRNYFF